MTEQHRTGGMNPADLLDLPTAGASTAEARLHLHHVVNALDRIARGAPDAAHLAEHAQRNLACALRIMAVEMDAAAADLRAARRSAIGGHGHG
jgi:hypothetical protein